MDNIQTEAGKNSGAGSPTEPMSASQTSGGTGVTSPIAPPPEPSRVTTSTPYTAGAPASPGEANVVTAPPIPGLAKA